jgi:hypothetical protein
MVVWIKRHALSVEIKLLKILPTDQKNPIFIQTAMTAWNICIAQVHFKASATVELPNENIRY